jgi:hypothetical protein
VAQRREIAREHPEVEVVVRADGADDHQERECGQGRARRDPQGRGDLADDVEAGQRQAMPAIGVRGCHDTSSPRFEAF